VSLRRLKVRLSMFDHAALFRITACGEVELLEGHGNPAIRGSPMSRARSPGAGPDVQDHALVAGEGGCALVGDLNDHMRRGGRVHLRNAEAHAGHGSQAIGEGRDTPGSALLLRELERADPRPLWVSIRGGANTLAQALHTLRRTRSQAAAAEAVKRLRVYAISDHDDTGAWLRREFPDLFCIVSPGGYGNGTWDAMFGVVEGIDNRHVSNAWIVANIQQGHGPLGAAYPDIAYGMEGDTPSFLALLPNGLNAPEHPDWGGWGGRYALYTPRREDTDPAGFNGGVPIEAETRPIWTNAIDRYRPHAASALGRPVKSGEREFSGAGVTLWRWREAFQNDFAARMLWTTRAPAEANHAPVVRLTHAAALQVRVVEAHDAPDRMAGADQLL
jgi:hypothetical protein